MHLVSQKIRDQMSNISGEKPRRFQKQKTHHHHHHDKDRQDHHSHITPRESYFEMYMCEEGRYQALLLNSSWALESKASLQLQSWIERDRVVFRNEGAKHRCQHAVSLLWESPPKRPPQCWGTLISQQPHMEHSNRFQGSMFYIWLLHCSSF